MKLSELIDRCLGADPELAIEDEHGIPRPVAGIDFGVRLTDGGQPVAYVLLEPSTEDD